MGDRLKKLQSHAHLLSVDALYHLILHDKGGDISPDDLSMNLKETIVNLGTEQRPIRRISFGIETAPTDVLKFSFAVASDVNKCMICFHKFSSRTGKLHCCGCGNVVCNHCCEEVEVNNFACFQCFWGQDFVPLSPSNELGLPVVVSNLETYGPVEIINVKPMFVLSCAKSSDNSVVLINLCISPLIPENSEKISPVDMPGKHLIFMVHGPSFFTEDGAYVTTVTINDKVLNDVRTFNKTRDNYYLEICNQVIDFISRVTLDKLQPFFDIDEFFPFYDPSKPINDNKAFMKAQDSAKSKLIKRTGEWDYRDKSLTARLKIVIPVKECFYSLFQIPVYSTSFSKFTSGNELYTASTYKIVNEAFSGEVDSENNSLEESKFETIDDLKDGPFNAPMLTLGDKMRTLKFSDEVDGEYLPNHDQHSDGSSIPPGLVEKGKFVSKYLSRTVHSAPTTSSRGREDVIDAAHAKNLVKMAIKDPSLLVGWQILLLDSRMEPKEKVEVIKFRKTLFRRTEFCVKYNDSDQLWIRLRCNERKGGFNFRPLQDLKNI